MRRRGSRRSRRSRRVGGDGGVKGVGGIGGVGGVGGVGVDVVEERSGGGRGMGMVLIALMEDGGD